MQTISLYLKLVIWYNKFTSESVLREKAKEFAKILFLQQEKLCLIKKKAF